MLNLNINGVKMKIFDALKTYLADWKNLLTHAIVGIGSSLLFAFCSCCMVLESNFINTCNCF